MKYPWSVFPSGRSSKVFRISRQSGSVPYRAAKACGVNAVSFMATSAIRFDLFGDDEQNLSASTWDMALISGSHLRFMSIGFTRRARGCILQLVASCSEVGLCGGLRASQISEITRTSSVGGSGM
jgi:hypothetical protein